MVNGIKKIIYILFALVLCNQTWGQGPSMSPHDLKESYLEKRASFESSRTKTISSTNQAELDRIVNILEENAPASYEYHLVKYINGNYDLSLKDHLFKAYELRPDDPFMAEQMFAYYVLTDDKGKQKEIASRLKRKYSANVSKYYTELTSTSGIGALFLSGEEDAYPVLVLQASGLIDSKITVVNMDFLQNDIYRKRIQKKLGMSNVPFVKNESMFIATALSALGNKAFISTTVSQAYIKEPAGQCYLTGLHYQYQCNDQEKALIDFWVKAQKTLTGIDLDSRYEKSLYSNYLPPLLTLYKLKTLNGKKDPALKKGIVLLAKQIGKEEAVTEILKGYDQTTE